MARSTMLSHDEIYGPTHTPSREKETTGQVEYEQPHPHPQRFGQKGPIRPNHEQTPHTAG